MTRYLTTILVFAIASFWVGAQGTRAKPRADEQAKLFERNRGMIEKLVDGSLKLSSSRDSLGKSQAYKEVLAEMGGEIRKASDRKDRERMKELATHLGYVLMQGVVPNLESARREIPAGSQDERALLQLRDSTGELVKGVLSAMPDVPGEGKEAKQKIQEAKQRVEALK